MEEKGGPLFLEYELLLARSGTRAEKMQALLRRRDIESSLVRPPMALTDRGCTYALKIRVRDRRRALEILETAGLAPSRV